MIGKNIAIICSLAIAPLSFNPARIYQMGSALPTSVQIDGVFRINKVSAENFRGQGLFTKYLVTTLFPTDTLDTESFDNRKYAGSVSLNNNSVNYYENFQLYMDTTIDLSSASGFYWNIGGSTYIGAFTYINTNQIPDFNYSGLTLPTEIDTSSDLVITLSQVSHADSVFINLTRTDSVAANPLVIKRYVGGSGNLTVEKQYLKQFHAGQNLFLQIELSNYNYQTISGKNYYFINSFDYRKQVSIKQQQQ